MGERKIELNTNNDNRLYNEENMALRKPIWEDSPRIGETHWRGDKAVDGFYTDRSAFGGQYVIPANEAERATWRVDLGGVVSIRYIDIYYRTDNLPRKCCKRRMIKSI